jgi:lycopene cyclase domain-containing protein
LLPTRPLPTRAETLVTGITYVLLTRPLLPSLSVPHTPTPMTLRLGWALGLVPVGICYELSRRSDHFLYLFAELLLVTPPLLLLFGTSTRFAFSPSAGRRTATVLSIVLPTLYFCWVDKVAIGEGAWFMNERWVTGVTFFTSLPLECVFLPVSLPSVSSATCSDAPSDLSPGRPSFSLWSTS